VARPPFLTETDGPFAKIGSGVLMPWDVEYAYAGLSNIWGGTELDAKQQVRTNLKTIISSM